MPLKASWALSTAVIAVASCEKCERLSESLVLYVELPCGTDRRGVYAPYLTADFFACVLLVSLLLASEAFLRNC